MVEYIKEDIEEVMEITGYSYTKAKKLFEQVAKDIDDGEDDELCSFDIIDAIKLEHKAKVNGVKNVARADEQTSEPKEKKPRVVKIADEKKELFSNIFNFLSEEYGENVRIINENKVIMVKMGEKTIKIDLVDTKKYQW